MKELMNMAKSFINLEEKLHTQFDNLVASETNSSRLTGKETHRRKDESDRRMHSWYDKYTPLKCVSKCFNCFF